MVDFLKNLFSTDFVPHASCLRLPGVIQLHVWSDILIAASYGLIPIALLRLVRRRQDLVFPWMFALFGLFILSCGFTHALGAWTLWHPIYRFDGLVKAFTAIVSLPTAVLLVGIVPKVLELPSPLQLRNEITDRKRAEQEVKDLNAELELRIQERTRELVATNVLLAQSERRRLLAIEVSGLGTWVLNLESGEVIWDQTTRSIFGLSQREGAITIEVFYGLVHTADLPRVEASLKEARLTGEIRNLEYRILRPDGAERWIRSIGSTDPADPAESGTLQGTTIDITDQKKMEMAIARLASIVESSEDAVIGLDTSGNVTSWNRSASRMFGYNAEEVLGSTILVLSASQQPDEMNELLSRIRQGQRIEHFETVRARKNGDLLDISLTISPIIDGSGQIVGASKIARDITRRKQTDAALRNSEERFRMLAETVPDILFIADASGTINFLSARFFSEVGGSQQEFNPHTAYLNAIHPEDAGWVAELWKECIRDRKSFQAEFRLRKKSGGYRWFVTRCFPVADEEQAILHWIGSTTDIDQLKKAESALMQSNEELRQFAYAAAHDLQEPLRNVVNAAGMLRMSLGDRLSGYDKQYLQFCSEGAERMHAMIKDLLAFTTVVDSVVSETAFAQTGEVIKEVEANLALSISESNAAILYSDLPEVAVEPTHLLQLLQNIIGNALKYRSPHRAPVIRVSAQKEADDWCFEIVDNGIGFSAEYNERIFKVFRRLHLRSEFPGNGIGLAICARIAAHYGGKISAKGFPDQGATFTFTLPSVKSNRIIDAGENLQADVAG